MAVCFAFAPPVIPTAFNTSFVMTLAGHHVFPKTYAFWSYDANVGGQYVWHPVCPFGGSTGCSLFFRFVLRDLIRVWRCKQPCVIFSLIVPFPLKWRLQQSNHLLRFVDFDAIHSTLLLFLCCWCADSASKHVFEVPVCDQHNCLARRLKIGKFQLFKLNFKM